MIITIEFAVRRFPRILMVAMLLMPFCSFAQKQNLLIDIQTKNDPVMTPFTMGDKYNYIFVQGVKKSGRKQTDYVLVLDKQGDMLRQAEQTKSKDDYITSHEEGENLTSFYLWEKGNKNGIFANTISPMSGSLDWNPTELLPPIKASYYSEYRNNDSIFFIFRGKSGRKNLFYLGRANLKGTGGEWLPDPILKIKVKRAEDIVVLNSPNKEKTALVYVSTNEDDSTVVVLLDNHGRVERRDSYYTKNCTVGRTYHETVRLFDDGAVYLVYYYVNKTPTADSIKQEKRAVVNVVELNRGKMEVYSQSLGVPDFLAKCPPIVKITSAGDLFGVSFGVFGEGGFSFCFDRGNKRLRTKGFKMVGAVMDSLNMVFGGMKSSRHSSNHLFNYADRLLLASHLYELKDGSFLLIGDVLGAHCYTKTWSSNGEFHYDFDYTIFNGNLMYCRINTQGDFYDFHIFKGFNTYFSEKPLPPTYSMPEPFFDGDTVTIPWFPVLGEKETLAIYPKRIVKVPAKGNPVVLRNAVVVPDEQIVMSHNRDYLIYKEQKKKSVSIYRQSIY